MKDVLTVRLDAATRARLDALAEATDRTRSYLVSEAIGEYLTTNSWQVPAIQEGVRQADAGQVAPHDAVRRKWAKKKTR